MFIFVLYKDHEGTKTRRMSYAAESIKFAEVIKPMKPGCKLWRRAVIFRGNMGNTEPALLSKILRIAN
jgi:hypothetical protein